MRQPSVIARRVAAASVSLVVAAGAAACGPEDNDAKSVGGDSTPHKGGTLTVLNAGPQQDFDPARLYTSGGGNVPSLVFRTLIGLALVFVAHDLAVVRQVSDRVVVMRRGRIVEEGPADEVYDNPRDPYTKRSWPPYRHSTRGLRPSGGPRGGSWP